MTDEDNSSMNETQKLGTPVSNLATSPKTVVGSPFLTRDDIGSQTIEKNGQAKSVRIGRDGRTYISARELGMLVKSSKNANGIIEVPAKNHILPFKITVRSPTGSFLTYHSYKGGAEFRPVLPRNRLAPGQRVWITLEPLSRDSFVYGIQSFELASQDLKRWEAERVVVDSFTILDDKLEIHFIQDHPLVALSNFVLSGRMGESLGASNQYGGVYLPFVIVDYIGRMWMMRIRHDGSNRPQFQIDRGAGCETVSLISFDGFRLTFRYGRSGAVSTCYLCPPSDEMYDLAPPRAYSGKYLALVQNKYSRALIIDKVKIKRNLERQMLDAGSVYDQGRIGSEIAYLYAVRYLGLQSVVLEEPSKNGKDLYTMNKQSVIQTRMIKAARRDHFELSVQTELLDLIRKLGQDFRYNGEMIRGYGALSFVNRRNDIKTIVVEVTRDTRVE